MRPELRDRVVFAPQNVLQDPPFSRLDIATCRNLLIYLEPEVQQRVLALLHFGLREGGALFLGTQRDGRRGRGPVRADRQEGADLPAGRADPARGGRVPAAARAPAAGEAGAGPAGGRAPAGRGGDGARPSIAQLTQRHAAGAAHARRP